MSASVSRITLSLDGSWNIAESVRPDDVPKVYNRTVPVPGLVNLAQPPFPQVDEFEGYELNEARIRSGEIPESERVAAPGRSQQPRDYFWYRRTFKAPAGKSVAVLTISRAQFGMAIWLNGQSLGQEPGCYNSGHFDLSPAIRWGTENELVVRIGAHPAVLPASYPSGTDFEKHRWTPGIYDSVSVAFCDNPFIGEIQVAPRLNPRAIVVQTKIVNRSPNPRTAQVAHRVSEWQSGTVIAHTGPESIVLAGGEERIVVQTIPLPDARLWSPVDPFLHVLETSTAGDGVQTRFGLREFRSDAATGVFYLNDQPCRLRGSNIALHRFLEDPNCAALPWTEAWVKKLLGEIPRRMHWNAFRFHVGGIPRRWLEIADECGLLIQYEFGIWTGHPKWHAGYARHWDSGELIRQYSAWMRDHWNHPSIVIWDACNETFDPVFGEEVIPAVRGLDLSNRPWDNGYNPPVDANDPAEIHPYFHASSFWEKRVQYDPAELATKTFDQVVDVGVAEKNQTGHPLIINEYGWLWLNRDGTPTQLTGRLYDMLLGTAATAEQRFKFYAYTVALETEFFRASRRFAGILHFVYLTYSHPKGATSDSFRDITALTLDPYFADYVAEAFKPLGVCLHFFQRTLVAGSARAFTINLVNDRGHPVRGTLTLVLETPKGEVIARATENFTMESFGQTSLELALTIPSVTGPHVLKAQASSPSHQTEAPTISRRTVEVISELCELDLPLQPGEKWWGGRVVDSANMPYSGSEPIRRSLYAESSSEENQVQPLLLSNRGRYVWNEGAFDFEFSRDTLHLSRGATPWLVGESDGALKGAFRAASRRFFPPSGGMPAKILFTAPQYNTWIELLHDQTEEKILNYARSIITQGYPPGVLMIDDNWQENYGVWEFSPRRFSDPKGMIRELHALGFRVMLWVCPFVSSDSAVYRDQVKKKWLLRERAWTGQPAPMGLPADTAMVRWWNGVSAVLDLSHPEARAWFEARLDRLVTEFDVDGFKFDAGDSGFYLPSTGGDGYRAHLPRTPQEHTMDYARLGLKYSLNEYRACWKLAGQPLGQRLRDKDHSWTALRDLIPGAIAQGLMGYAFCCPDLIGGGLAGAFEDPAKFDPELVVRSAQVHALMPMMQFSVAPWRVLDAEMAKYCLDAARLHTRFGNHILDLAQHAALTGDPIVRPLAWAWPDGGYEAVHDQFVLGDDIVVAPVVAKGARSRTVLVPPGRWVGDDGSTVDGPRQLEISVPLGRLPYYTRQK